MLALYFLVSHKLWVIMVDRGGQSGERALTQVAFLYVFIASGPATGVFLKQRKHDLGWVLVKCQLLDVGLEDAGYGAPHLEIQSLPLRLDFAMTGANNCLWPFLWLAFASAFHWFPSPRAAKHESHWPKTKLFNCSRLWLAEWFLTVEFVPENWLHQIQLYSDFIIHSIPCFSGLGLGP